MILDLLIILVAGLFGGLICRKLQLPLMLGYLVVGVVIGGAALGWIEQKTHEIEHLAELGVLLLLFTIGLEFSLDELGKLSRYLLVGGATQMLVVAVPVGIALYFLGSSPQAALLLAAAVAFSSTVVVFRVLAELGHTASPHGERAVAILLFQDAALVPLLLAVPLLTGGEGQAGPVEVLLLILNSILLLSAVVVLRWAVKRWASHVLANLRSPELVLLFVLAMLGAVTYGAYQVGLPPALGAFAAGLIFNGNRLTAQVDALVLPFRQTFAAMFFVSLGLLLQPGILGAGILSLLLMLAIVFVLKGAAGLIALRLTGLSWKASAGMGVGLAHLGEFSLVLGLTGMTAGVIPQDDYQRLLCVALASLILTPFLLKLGLRWTEPSFPETDEAAPASHGIARWSPHTAVVIGAGPIGRQVTSQLETIGCNVCLIDLSPVNLHPFALQGIHTVAGDARDPAVLRNAGVRDAELLVLSLPDDRVAIHVLRAVREVNTKAMSVVRCRYQNNEQHLREAGAEHVISEEVLAAGAVLRLLRQLENELPVSQQVARKAASQVSAEGG